jgi:hypothetical protein
MIQLVACGTYWQIPAVLDERLCWCLAMDGWR